MVEVAVRAGRVPQLAKYEIREEIGHGGMATVYRALDTRLGREVAVKVIHPHLRNSTEVISRFHAEAQAVAKLRHRNIVEVYDVGGPDEPEQYLVVELVRGTTLRRLMQEQGALPPEIAAAIGVELLDALAHAHANGVIHRDLKPENVLIEHRKASTPGEEAKDGARVVVKLTDFGIAKLLDAQGVTSTGQVLGSPAHMAPEQIEGGDVDGRSDVFGLGVLLYECMVGRLPFAGSNPAQVLRRVLEGTYSPAVVEQPRVGARWSAIVDRALAHDRHDRFADAAAMRDAVVAELTRLGFWPAEDELDVSFTDPEAYRVAYAGRIVERLRQRADEARRRGDALVAANDYNRALAHAPDDPRLLRIVAGMRRVERRNRLLRTWGLAAVGAVAAGVATFGVVHAVRGHAGETEGGAVVPSRVVLAVPAPPASGESQHAVAAPMEIAPSDVAVSASGRAPSVPPPRLVDRHLTLDLIPPMGVTVSVDRQPSRPVSTGDVLTVDSRGHGLVFSCAVCSATPVTVAPGEHDDTLVVSVPVKPAVLVIEGEVDRTYQIAEHPELTVRAGTNTIPLKSAYERVTIKQIETGGSVPVRLEAGQAVHVQL